LGSTGEPELEQGGNGGEGFKGGADRADGGEGGKVCWPLGRGGSVGGRKSKGTFTSMVSSFLFMICFLLLQLNPALKCE